MKFLPTICLILALAVASGCGSSDKGTVKGKLLNAGQPVTGGSVTFAPVTGADTPAGRSGKPAIGAVQPDGTFVLGTDEAADGALIGRHEVNYSPPSPAGETPSPDAARSPYDGMVPQPAEVDVKPGKNEFTIELVPKPATP